MLARFRRRVRRFKKGEKDTGDRPPQRPTRHRATAETKDKVFALIRDDRHITTSELCTAIGIGKPSLTAIIR